MKRLTNLLMLLIIATSILAQTKPDKTFDFEKFGKKVYGNFSAGMDQSFFLPDDKALEFISLKTGRTMDELKAERELNKQYLSDDKGALQKENAGGQMILKVELVKVDNPKLTMGNIIVTAGGKRIEFRNCIQTDRTWVLGDYMGIEGGNPTRVKPETKDDAIAKYLAKNERDYKFVDFGVWNNYTVIKVDTENPNGILKIGAQLSRENFYNVDFKILEDGKSAGYLNKGEKIVNSLEGTYKIDQTLNKLTFTKDGKTINEFDIKSASKEELILVADIENAKYYFVVTKAAVQEKTDNVIAQNSILYGMDVNVLFHSNLQFKKDLVGKVLRGFYITADGNKVNAPILYDDPNNMHNNGVELSIYKTAFGEQGFTSEIGNFDKKVPKSGLKAFFVAEQLFIKAGDSWFVLLDEGAIRRLVKNSSIVVSNIPAKVEKPELIGKPVRGYYIDNDGKKFDVVIKYQNVEQLQNMTSTFLIYNIAYNENGFTDDETNNFKTFLMKSQVKEFNLGGSTYYKAEVPFKLNSEWRVRVDEVNYSTTKYICKIGENPIEEGSLLLGFKNTMSKLTADNVELSTKIANKEKGFTFLNFEKIVTDYNAWYEKQYPGKNKPVLSDTKTVKE